MSDELSFAERISKNNSYYDQFAQHVAKRTENRDYTKAYEAFLSRLPEHPQTILDIGCGTGQHLSYFAKLDLQVLGIGPSLGMRNVALTAGLQVIDGTFESISKIELPEISGIWCAASLLHVPNAQLATVFTDLAKLLPHRGPLFFTVRLGEGAKWDRFDGEDGNEARFIQLFSEEDLSRAVNDAKFQIAEKWIETSTWGRPCEWISMVLVG
jgi:SAM-dependent methyltransferase